MTLVGAERLLSIDDARLLGRRLLEAVGAPRHHADVVAAHLVESSLVGAHSHGMLRLPQYLDDVREDRIDPRATPVVERSQGTFTTVDGRRGFGHVAALFAVTRLAHVLRSGGVAAVAVHRSGHAGRIGAYVELLAMEGFAAMAFCSSPRSGHFVAPFGGAEGRFGTNPIAYAFPTASAPIVADFSTSTMSEGKARYHLYRGLPLPPGTLRRADGAPTSDPGALYEEPTAVLQPLGGEHFGYKGSMLALLVELFSTVAIGDDPLDHARSGNNILLVGFAVEEGARTRAAELAAYVRGCPPEGGETVVAPGDRERDARSRGTISVDARTWSEIERRAGDLQIQLPRTMGPGVAT